MKKVGYIALLIITIIVLALIWKSTPVLIKAMSYDSARAYVAENKEGVLHIIYDIGLNRYELVNLKVSKSFNAQFINIKYDKNDVYEVITNYDIYFSLICFLGGLLWLLFVLILLTDMKRIFNPKNWLKHS